MGDHERFDPAQQFVIGRALAVEEGDATGRSLPFEGGQEYSLDAARVERHGVVLASGDTHCAPSAAVDVEKAIKGRTGALVMERRGRGGPREVMRLRAA